MRSMCGCNGCEAPGQTTSLSLWSHAAPVLRGHGLRTHDPGGGIAMKLLWLTLADPDPPTNGQFLYSAGLIEATLSAGAEIEVVGFDRPEARHRDGYRSERVAWSLAVHRPRSRWRGLIAHAPYFSFRTMTSDMRRRVSAAVARADWDGIVFDSFALGWALPMVLRRYRNATARPRLVYIAHNH